MTWDDDAFLSDDPLVRYSAHQAAKGRRPMGDPDRERKRLRENGGEWPSELRHAELCSWRFGGRCDCRLSIADPNLDPYDAKRDAESEARYDRDPPQWEAEEWDRTHGGSGGYSGGEAEVSEMRAYRVGWWLVLTLFAVNLGLSVAQSDWSRTFGFTVIGGLWLVLSDGLLIPEAVES